MDKKIKTGMNTPKILCIVFGSLGAIYLLLGILLRLFPADLEDATAGLVFLILGSCFLVFAAGMLIPALAIKRRIRALLATEQYVWGEVADIVTNYYGYANGRCCYTVLCRYQDNQGVIHIFRSTNLKTYPDNRILGKQVKIYCQKDNFKHYHVDLDPILPKVMEH